MLIEKKFKRKPTATMVYLWLLRDAAKTGASHIVIQWGENQITLESSQNGWTGYGWIDHISGSDTADKLNRINWS